jgi:hypothetical protein
MLGISVTGRLAFLVIFKYANFLADNLSVPSAEMHAVNR